MSETMTKRITLWMAGDSTMQTYSEEQRPQWGWGELLLSALENRAGSQLSDGILADGVPSEPEKQHREDCPFGQQMRYTGKHFIVDNCAMAGRSTKTFREEGRLADIDAHIQPGEYLIIQFGHNDAGRGKPERYVPVEEFKSSLEHFTKTALDHKATPILVSSIALCPCEQNTIGEVGEIGRLLPVYAEVMRQYAQELRIPYIDMGRLTREYLEDKEEQQIFALYKEDRVHLVREGAAAYAGLAAGAIFEIVK